MDIATYRRLTVYISNCRQWNQPEDEKKWVVARYIWCVENNCSFFKGVRKHTIRSRTKFKKLENYIRHVQKQNERNKESENEAALIVREMGYCCKTGKEFSKGSGLKLPRFTG